jgi:hypothetical protein
MGCFDTAGSGAFFYWARPGAIIPINTTNTTIQHFIEPPPRGKGAWTETGFIIAWSSASAI